MSIINSAWIPTQFNIYGCEYSTDLDIGILVPNQDIIIQYKNKNIILDFTNIFDKLKILGFNLDIIKLDINLIYIDPKSANLSMCLLGSKDTQNIIYYTYSLHPQSYPIFFTSPILIDIEDKIRFMGKFILDNLVNLLGKQKYIELRSVKKNVYMDLIQRNIFSMQILKQTNFIDIFHQDPDLIKSLAMKLLQLILLSMNIYVYTKNTISLQAANNINGICKNSILYILSRGKLGSIDKPLQIQNQFDILIEQYNNIILSIESKLNLQLYPIDLQMNILDSDLFANEFIKSPKFPTQTLQTHIDTLYSQTNSLNQIFILHSFNCDKLPQQIIQHIHTENQRSTQWLDLLKFYHCGNSINNQIKFVNTVTNFNLVRGCIVEKILIDYLDWNKIIGFNVTKCVCGLLVEEKGVVNSKGIAPDLLLIGDTVDLVIPVEIKCLVTNSNIINNKFLREIILAKKQLKTSIDLINKILQYDTFGLIVFCFITDANIIDIKFTTYK